MSRRLRVGCLTVPIQYMSAATGFLQSADEPVESFADRLSLRLCLLLPIILGVIPLLSAAFSRGIVVVVVDG